VGFEMGWDREDMVAGNFDALILGLDDAGNELGEKLIAMLFKTMSAVTESTGNVVDAGGKKFSFELLVENEDELVMPSIVMHPDQMKDLPNEATPEEQAILDDLHRRKPDESYSGEEPLARFRAEVAQAKERRRSPCSR
jgi:hypothetical protein